jgi:threonine dehydrogenase-like Zn-dependent dehydrogenase
MALDLLREKVVDGNALISHVFPLDRIAEAFQVAARDPSAIKVVIQP